MTFCLQFKSIIYVIFGDIVVCRVYKRICGSYQIYYQISVRSLSLRLLDLKSIRFGARYTESIYRSGLFPQVLFLPLSPLLSLVSSSSLLSSFSSLLSYPSSLLSSPFFLSIFPSLLSSLFCLLSSPSFILSSLSSYYLLSLSFFFPFLFLSSSLLLFFSALSPSPLCFLRSALFSLLILIFDFSDFDNLSKLKWWKWWIIRVQ